MSGGEVIAFWVFVWVAVYTLLVVTIVKVWGRKGLWRMRNRQSAKKAGSSFERLIADYLRDHWDDRIDRRVKTGALDKGDIANFRVNGSRITVECKDQGRYDFATALKEAHLEAINDDSAMGIAVVKRHGKSHAADQFVVMTLSDLIKLLRINADMIPVKAPNA